MEEELIKYKDSAPELYQKLISYGDDDDEFIQLSDDIVSHMKGFFNNRFRDEEFGQYIGNESTNKISKNDFMNLAGYSYDEYIKNKEAEDNDEDNDKPEQTGSGRGKRSSKRRRSMRKGNKKKRVKTRRRK